MALPKFSHFWGRQRGSGLPEDERDYREEEQDFGDETVGGYDPGGYGPDAQLPVAPPSYLAGTSTYLYRAEPRTFEDAGPIADCLKEGHPVVVNMEKADAKEAQRIRDFLRGAAYALGGDVRKVAQRVYACVPADVQIQPLRIDTAAVREASAAPGSSSAEDSGYWPDQ